LSTDIHNWLLCAENKASDGTESPRSSTEVRL